MKATVITIITIISLFLLNVSNVHGQVQTSTPSKPSPKYNRLAVGVKASHLYDLKFKPNKTLDNGFIAEDMKGLNGSKTKLDLSFGIDVSYFFSPLFSLDASFDMGKMTGSGNVEYYESNVQFYTLGANINLKRSLRTEPYKLVPYFRVSIANARYDVERKFIEDNITYSSIKDNCLQVGFGGGIRYHLSHNLHLNLMTEFVTSYTDAWDGYDYADGNDHMIKTTLGLRYTFGRNNHVDKGLAWQDRRVDDLVAGTDQTEAINKTLQALSDSLRIMRESLATVKNELNDRMARENADLDRDGVLDRNDICPDVYGPTYNNGCPDTTKAKPAPVAAVAVNPSAPSTGKPTTAKSPQQGSGMGNIDLAQVKKMLLIELNTIKFPSGQATLDEQALDILHKTAVIMENNPNFKLIALGYTDTEGKDEVNMRLSKLRASAVVNYLAKIGVPKNQLEMRAMGKANPVDKRNTNKAKANNRRVEFLVETL